MSGKPKGSQSPAWAACVVDGATGTFLVGSEHIGFVSCARHPAVPAGDYDLVLDGEYAILAGKAEMIVMPSTFVVATPQSAVCTQVDSTHYRVRVSQAGALADGSFTLSIRPLEYMTSRP